MNKIFITALVAVLSFMSTTIISQNKLTLEDVIAGGRNFYDYFPKRYYAGFMGKSSDIYFTRNDVLYSMKNGKGKEEVLVVLTDLNQKLEEAGAKSLKYWPQIKWINENVISFVSGEKYVQYNISEGEAKILATAPGKARNRDFCYENNMIAFTKGNDLYVTKNDSSVLIAAAEKKGIVYGQAVHRNEFGINKGTYWSPKGNYLAFYRNDQSMVADYPLVNIETRIATVENIKYPMAGMTSEQVAVCIYNVNTGDTIHLKTASPVNRYFTNIAWTPDEKYILIAELNRDQNHMQMIKYDATTGEKVSVLFEERDEQWVEPQHPALFVPGSDDLFVWQSMRDGHNHMFLYNTSGKLIKNLTDDDVEVMSVLGFNSKGNMLYFMGTTGDAMNRYLYSTSLSSGRVNQIIKNEGYHTAKVSSNGKNILDFYSSLDVPFKADLLDGNGLLKKNLFTSPDPFKEKGVKTGEIKLLKVKSADGKTDLNARIVLPVDFDPSKKYPVIIYVYGGPHSQLVANRWHGGASGWQLYMAQEGYIAFTMDNRGTSNRGAEFEQVIHRHLGKAEVADQMKGVEYLKSLPYVDTTRIGVHGWSYGGFMTTSLMVQHPEVFKVGVAGGPVIDWKYYEVMYGERYMDTPQENPEGYKESNLNNQVKGLKGRFMIIHGAIDPVVVWQHSLTFVRACVENEIQLDYFVYPRHEHNVRGHDRIHLMKKVTRYFEDFL
ncbi:MAG: prolyl oligopeptidase family serine peptidase [Chlorobi bacterium]|nr:prolyl oligopeptidase family serine peptidase [Chlorobiota bacterium]